MYGRPLAIDSDDEKLLIDLFEYKDKRVAELTSQIDELTNELKSLKREVSAKQLSLKFDCCQEVIYQFVKRNGLKLK